jgi:DNA-binding GntR family transcriptional regulator
VVILACVGDCVFQVAGIATEGNGLEQQPIAMGSGEPGPWHSKSGSSRRLGLASDEQLAGLRAAHESVVADSVTGIHATLVARAQAVDWGLHDTIIDALDNEIISNAYRVNSVKIRLIRQELTRLDSALVVPVMQEHLRIVAALESRDPQRAAAEITAHIDNARNRALGLAGTAPA